MTALEFNELLDFNSELQFDRLEVIMDNDERVEFTDGNICYNARGNYYLILAHGYKHNGNSQSYAQNVRFTVTIFCSGITFIDYK